VRRAAVVCLAGLLLSAPAHAIEFSGQYTNLLFHTRGSLGQAITTDLNRLRLRLEGAEGPFSWEVVYDNEILWGGLVRDPLFQTLSALPPRTWADLTATILDSGAVNWQHTLYRGWLQYEEGPLQITAGRQRMAWGSGRIWNPTDRFNPVDPTALEPEQKTGVDAGVVVWRYSESATVQAVVTPGRQAHDVSRKWILRWQDTFGETDVALLGGRIGEEDVFGLDITGNVADGTARVELMQAWPVQGKAYMQLSAGYDYTLINPWLPAGLYLAIEYFYNGAPGVAAPAVPVDRLQTLKRSLLGFMAGYDLTPLWRLDLLLLADTSAPSVFFMPQLTWSAANNIDIGLFAQLPAGTQTGEFARFDELLALRMDWYF